MPFTASDICKILLAIILPPVGVFLERGCGTDLLINILLTILGKTLLISSSEYSVVPTVHHPASAYGHQQYPEFDILTQFQVSSPVSSTLCTSF
ncbi:hypothetical protein FOXB_02934 [Fusarium oxysporum f. sp. conglutinans Fo5176]|uniref:Plasma membrane proteolipid 3 n=1 Tax=Fusarium oxysporum (strain Fo5176) TaxID=660025 RepID=F9F959_FUSOF|nr:hypothetical protein FOXB_02934 [Fusarium oxysporum f. sp. conglutinans Fo5176]